MSFSHMVLLGIIALVVIPPDKLPEVARQLARFLNDVRRSTTGLWDDLKQEAILKPEDLMKIKNENTIRPPVAPAANTVVNTMSDDDYAKHIQAPNIETQTSVTTETITMSEKKNEKKPDDKN